MIANNSAPRPHIGLQRMPHELYIRRSGEDWAGINNQRERKKLQNRLNKRASRQRKTGHQSRPQPSSAILYPATSIMFHDCTQEDILHKRAYLQRFAEQALKSYSSCDPCADHRLRLIQLNTINGLTWNAAMIGFEFDWLVCACVSPFGCEGHSTGSEHIPPSFCPDNLKPTSLQLETRHHPWIDLFPLPRMRDNLLSVVAGLNSTDEEHQLFVDTVETSGGPDWAGLVVWGEPWDYRNWEVTLPFLRKWEGLLRGCPEIVEATNYWRSQRGEAAVAFDAT